MEYIILTEAIHPTTKEIYKVGDKVIIYQGRLGHDNIMTINSMFTTAHKKGDNMVYVSENIYTKLDYRQPWPYNPKGTYLNAVKRKISKK